MPRSLLTCLTLMVCVGSTLGAPLPLLPPDKQLDQVVDHYIDAGLKEAKIKPAAPADDAEFLRRLTLDLVGRIPTVEETKAYLANTDPAKKTQAVDRLMASPGFIRHQAQELLAMLQVEEPGRKGIKRGPLHEYLLAAAAENRSWERIFRELMLPDPENPKQKGATEFIKPRLRDANRLTVDVSSIFFGVNVSSAQCHDHPHVPTWTQDHFYGMKAFLARTVDNAGFVAEKDFGVVKYIPNKGKEKVAPVMFLTGKTIDDPGMKEPSKEQKKAEHDRLEMAKKSKKATPPPSFSLRAKLVETALEPGQRDYLARSIVNRTWNRFLGRGLVMPLDQMHLENPASHPELLQWLARDLIDHGYDLKRVVRGLVLSHAYARGSRWEQGEGPPEKLFAVAPPRALAPMQMAAALKLATTDPATLPSDKAELEKRLDALEKSGARWGDLFPQPGDNFQVSVSEAMLFANNGGLLKELLEGPGTLTVAMLKLPVLEQRADLAIRTTLSRPARLEEVQALADYMRRRADRPEAAAQQVVWALLTSAEFRFNH